MVAVSALKKRMAGQLYLVATPIGNLQDITLRAIETMRTADIIACEDTRHTQKLLNHFDIKKKLISYHEHNEETRALELVNKLLDGASVAVVSDAGTPAINDPGFRIVHDAIEAGIEIVPIPGASALVTAISASGLPTDTIMFGGFLPARKGERRKRLRELRDVPATLVFYEAPHRIAASLSDCFEELGDRPAVVARELTKIHEEFVRGPLSRLRDEFHSRTAKGEIVLLVAHAPVHGQAKPDARSLHARIAELESAGSDRRSALKQAAKEFGLSRSEAYRELEIAKKP